MAWNETDRETARKKYQEGEQIALGYLDDKLHYQKDETPISFEEAEEEAREWFWVVLLDYFIYAEEVKRDDVKI